MSFTQENLSKSSTGYAHKVSGQEWLYQSPTDTLAAIKTEGYFDEIAQLFSLGEVLNVGDLTFERDIIEVFEINATFPKIKTKGFVGGGSIPDGSITTPKLADLAVTAPKLGNLAVTGAKIANFTIDNDKVVTQTLRESSFNTEAVSTRVIEDFAVTKVKIASTVLGVWRLMNIFEVPTTNTASQIVVITGAVAGDRAFAVFSANQTVTPPGLFIVSTVFVDPNTISIIYNVNANSATDKIQIFHYRLIT